MRTPQDVSLQARMDRVEQRLVEYQRKTLTNLAVTSNGVEYINVNKGGDVVMSDNTGSLIFWSDDQANGYTNPLLNVSAFLWEDEVMAVSYAFTGQWFVNQTAKFYPTSPAMFVEARVHITSPDITTLAEAEWYIDYRVSGGTWKEMRFSRNTAPGPGDWQVLINHEWPDDIYGQPVDLRFWSRIVPGTGDPDQDYVWFTPVSLTGNQA